MDVDIISLVPLAVLGAILGLDVVSFPQAMISRPLVAATAAGALIGAPGRGLAIGAALEFFALESLPFGASRYPEWGSASVVGGALFASVPEGTTASMTVAVLAALSTASIGGSSMVALRRWNARLARRQVAGHARDSGSAVVGLQLAGLTADLVRGAVITFVALLCFRPLYPAIIGSFEIPTMVSRAVVVSVASAVGIAAVWKVVYTTPGARWWLLGGLSLGLAIAAGLL
jgi:PTS system mannose-specific IIC component